VIASPGTKFGVSGMSAIATADADAPPASAKVSPAALNAGTAPLANRFFFFEACFAGCMVGSSERCKKHPTRNKFTLRKSGRQESCPHEMWRNHSDRHIASRRIATKCRFDAAPQSSPDTF
jgi:hypothetical protein